MMSGNDTIQAQTNSYDKKNTAGASGHSQTAVKFIHVAHDTLQNAQQRYDLLISSSWFTAWNRTKQVAQLWQRDRAAGWVSFG